MSLNSYHISLKDVAREVGVSCATVSLVLSGKAEKGRISEDVAEQVFRAAKEMNYRPNKVAHSLRTGKTKILGLIVPDISNPFYAKLSRQIEDIAGLKGYQLMFSSSEESSRKFEKLVSSFVEQNVDGIIAVPPQNSESVIMQLIERCVPIIFVDRKMENVPVSSVLIDHFGISLALSDYLIGQGCKRIAFVTYNTELPNVQQCHEGYLFALRKNKICIGEELTFAIPLENIETDIKLHIDSILKVNIDSIIFMTNDVAMQSLIELRRHKKAKTLKYASIDAYEEYKILDSPIVCIEQPIRSMGQRALDILFKQIEDRNYKAEIETVSLRAQLRINRS